MLIYINDKEVQDNVEKDFGLKIPLYSVVDTTDGKYNSPLWFEMYRPDEKVISGYLGVS